MRTIAILLLGAALAAPATAAKPDLDVVITNGVIYDGSGGKPYQGWMAFLGDRIAAIGEGKAPDARRTLDAGGQAIAPGFVIEDRSRVGFT